MPGGVQIGPGGGVKIGATGGAVIASATGQPCCCGGGPFLPCDCRETGKALAYYDARLAVPAAAQCSPDSSAPDDGFLARSAYAGNGVNEDTPQIFTAQLITPHTVTFTGEDCNPSSTIGEECNEFGATTLGGFSLWGCCQSGADGPECFAYQHIKNVEWWAFEWITGVAPDDPYFGVYQYKRRMQIHVRWVGRLYYWAECTNVPLFDFDDISDNSYYSNSDVGLTCCLPWSGKKDLTDGFGDVRKYVNWALYPRPCWEGNKPPPEPPVEPDPGGSVEPDEIIPPDILPEGVAVVYNDPKPSAEEVRSSGMFTRIGNAIRAIPSIASAVVNPADAATQSQRLAVCNACPENSGGVCGALLERTGRTCGCMVSMKVRGRAEACPQGKW